MLKERKLINANVWNVIRSMKLDKSLFERDCLKTFEESSLHLNHLMDTFENILGVNPSKFVENITEESLRTAADMYLYLITCPAMFESWLMFYSELFLKASPDQIVLTLNRILKLGNLQKYKTFKTVGGHLFKRVTQLFSLQYPELQNLKNGKGNLTLLKGV